MEFILSKFRIFLSFALPFSIFLCGRLGRYETGKSAPSADVLNKMADALGTTADYIMNGSDNEVVSAQLTDKELLNQFEEVEKLDQEDKHLVKIFSPVVCLGIFGVWTDSRESAVPF